MRIMIINTKNTFVLMMSSVNYLFGAKSYAFPFLKVFSSNIDFDLNGRI